MPIPRRLLLTTAAVLACVSSYGARDRADSVRTRHKFGYAVSFEDNSIYYWKDAATNAQVPPKNFASNNYLKLDLSYAGFSAGGQAEAYLPTALLGYPEQYKGVALTNKYLSYRNDWLEVRAGDFYTQFGNGLLLRAWEDRSLGINTALEGGYASYSFRDIFRVTGLYGRPRYYLGYADSWLGGADASFSLSSLFGWGFNLSIEGSYLNKNERLDNADDTDFGMRRSVNGYSARLAFDAAGFTFRGEFVDRDPDPYIYNDFSTERSRAWLVEMGYNTAGFGALLSLRRLKHMDMPSEHSEPSLYTQINYLPALTQQYIYSLAMLNPYQTQSADEYGGQLDLFYNLPRGSKLGGERGMKTHLNLAAWGGKEKFTGMEQLFFADLGLDAEKQISQKFKAKALFSMQVLNPKINGELNQPDWWSYAAVADVTYKFNLRHSLRGELQHLWMKQDRGNWAALTVEYGLAPHWNIFAADMWNYGDTGVHYVNGGVSYTYSHIRAGLNAGRFKEGYQCAGGICRRIPAYTGANLTLSLSF